MTTAAATTKRMNSHAPPLRPVVRIKPAYGMRASITMYVIRPTASKAQSTMVTYRHDLSRLSCNVSILLTASSTRTSPSLSESFSSILWVFVAARRVSGRPISASSDMPRVA